MVILTAFISLASLHRDAILDPMLEDTLAQNMPSTTPSQNLEENISDFMEKESHSSQGSEANPQTTSTQKKPFLPQKKWQQALLFVGVLFLLMLGAAGVIGYFTYSTGMAMKAQAQEAELIARSAYDAFKTQNLPETENQLKILQSKITEIDETYSKLGFYKKIPWINQYYNDGEHALAAAEHGLNGAVKGVSTLTPYADVLGFEGAGSFSGGTAEDRIRIMIETLDKVMPAFDEITSELTIAEQEFSQIDPARYPEEMRGIAVRSQLVKVQETVNTTITALTDFRPVIEQLPAIAGGKGERKKYLILFQNDNELRPTGGFLTAYAVIYMENGKVSPEKSDDIYELDQKFNKKITIPESLGRYLTTEKYWNLRDMNISPDFKVSMNQFFENYQTVRGEPDSIDGIIAVDTHTLTRLLEVLGPVEVPGYGTFSAENDPRCDCPQVVYALSEIITKPTPYLREDRKGILGPMMQAILTKTYTANKQQWPQLFELAWKNLEERHVQMYFIEEKFQMAAENINGAGIMKPVENSDFLAIINANLGGAKSNLFTEYEMEQIVSAPENGEITKTLEITYKNTRKADNCNLEAGKLCLNSTLQDWTRLYLPVGSRLVDAQGFTNEPKEYDENGFSVIDGFFTLEPLGVAKIKVTYTVPYEDTETYRLKIWKQGGIDPIPTLLDVTGGQEKIVVSKDTIYTTEF